MTLDKNHGIAEQFRFEQVKSCPVIVNFKGKPVTSDAGLTLIAELDGKKEIASRVAACFKDYRDPSKVQGLLRWCVLSCRRRSWYYRRSGASMHDK